MARIDKVKYWIRSADQDWKVANHLFEKGDYSYALFFGHLTVEKILKAIFTDKKDKTPPFSHNLVYLSEKADLELNDENLELLEISIWWQLLFIKHPENPLNPVQKFLKRAII